MSLAYVIIYVVQFKEPKLKKPSFKRSMILPVVGAFLAVSVLVAGSVFASNVEFNKTDKPVSASASFDLIDKPVLLTNEAVNVYSDGTAVWGGGAYETPFDHMMVTYREPPADMVVPDWEYSVAGRTVPVAPGNTYVAGQCTWYAFNRRYQIGRPIGVFWGNGGSWHYSAAAAGFLVNHTPEVGAVFEEPGHVAYVEEVGAGNTVHISEMNFMGPYSYHERWISNASSYWYIH